MNASIFLGRDFDAGRDVHAEVPGVGGRHWLVGGSSGGGKTAFASAVIAQLARMPYTALCVSDPAWMDYSVWGPRLSVHALGREGAGWLLEQTEREMQWRLREGQRMGLQQITPSAEYPRLVCMLDEVAMVTMSSSLKNVKDRLIDLVQVGRKVAIGVVVMTQSPKATVVPMLVRENCGGPRVCFRTSEPEQTDAILGTQRIPAHRLHRPGEAFIRMPDGSFAHVRTPYVEPERCAEIARDTAHLTPTLPESRGWRRVFNPFDSSNEQQESA